MSDSETGSGAQRETARCVIPALKIGYLYGRGATPDAIPDQCRVVKKFLVGGKQRYLEHFRLDLINADRIPHCLRGIRSLRQI